jgi:UPF0755 protein
MLDTRRSHPPRRSGSRRTPRDGERRGRGLLIFLLVLILLATGAGGLYVWATGAPGDSRPVSVEVPQGATVAEVSDLLHQAGVVRSAVAFRLSAQVRGLDGSLQAGRYDLGTDLTLSQVLDELEEGPIIDEITLSVPEGLEVADIAAAAARELGIRRDEFMDLATAGRFEAPPYLPEGTETVEGFLFPKTYSFPAGVDADDVIERLLEQFEEETADLPWSRAGRLGLSEYEVVIVASMIEREVRVAEERPLVASVIYNRLRERMRLQIDATVQYALPEPNRPLTFDDYEFESPYNTYLIDGLPPTPIGSPGLASIRAALEPADTDYRFYKDADGDGRHGFARTFEEFQQLTE